MHLVVVARYFAVDCPPSRYSFVLVQDTVFAFLIFFIFDQKKEKITVPRDYFASKTLRRKKFQKGSFCPSSVYVVVGVCVCVCVCLFVRMFV